MSGWFLRGVVAAGDAEYEATFQQGEDRRIYRFRMEDVTVGAAVLPTLQGREFDTDSLLDRDAARLVLDAVVAVHKAGAQPIALTDRSGV
ncbi:hypothetical protein AB0H83_21170 [Dactylosporangium sp. NPDC050688]|uniref:hypothetical protein n=1 Tax=Dactylosporangium sp. NPDC050688 TaxID=3157217 RepID=UPI00340661B3